MANKALFAQLKQKFTTDTIIKRAGGKYLRVSDFNGIQAFGNLQQNTLANRFTRLYSNNGLMSTGLGYGVQIPRSQLYLEYEQMDQDALVGPALDILCEEATQVNEMNNEILSVRSSSEDIQDELYNLFYNVLNIEFNLPMWIRGMCLHGNTMIPLLDGTEIAIKDLVDKVKSSEEPIWVYSVQEGTNRVVPGKIKWCDLIKKNQEILRVTLDDDTYLDVTPDHEFVMRDGVKKQAKDLKEKESLMPFYTKLSNLKANCLRDYEMIYNPSTNGYKFTHRMVVKECNIKGPQEVEDRLKGIHYHSHHVDFNKRNNRPDNFKRMTDESHRKLHADLAKDILWGNEDIIKRRREGLNNWLHSEKHKAQMREKMHDVYPEHFKSYNSSELHKTHNEIRRKSMKESWASGVLANPPKLVLDNLCINYIKKLLVKKNKYHTLIDLVKLLKNDIEFNILYKNANSHHNRKLDKSFYEVAFRNMFKESIGCSYIELISELFPEGFKNRYYKKLKSENKSLKLKNHKVKSIQYLSETSDVYCMEVVGPNNEDDRHNFAVCSQNADGSYTRNGVFVGNCKYGDFFLNLKLSEDFGVYGAKVLSVYEMTREEGLDANNGDYIRFIQDPAAIMGGTSGIQSSRNHRVYENYEIAHFRLIKDSNFMPFGKSWLENGRKLFKAYVLMEDAAVTHRVTRSAEKRVFYYNVGNLPPNEIDAMMQKHISNQKRTPLKDPHTGEWDYKFNMMNLMEDYHIPVRGNDTSTRIDTAKGLEYAGMDDMNYFINKMFSALKVPKAYLNYSDELNGKSTLSGLSLSFSKCIEYIQRMAIAQLQKIAQVHLTLLGYDEADLGNFDLTLARPSILHEQERIALLKEKVDLCNQMQEKGLFSTDWQYDNIFQMSEDQVNKERDLIAEDAKRKFRYTQIEQEGNDPSLSGVSYGTPHDLASIYKNNASGPEEVPAGYDERKTVGRPITHASTYGTDASTIGRDPLGKKDMEDKYKKDSLKPKPRKGLYNEGLKKADFDKIRPGKKIKLYESEDRQSTELSLLDEANLLDID